MSIWLRLGEAAHGVTDPLHACLQLVKDKVNGLVQHRYPPQSEAVIKDPILFGDYKLAKSVSLNNMLVYINAMNNAYTCAMIQQPFFMLM